MGVVFLPTLSISWWGFEKGREGAKRKAGREIGPRALVEGLKHRSPCT